MLFLVPRTVIEQRLMKFSVESLHAKEKRDKISVLTGTSDMVVD